MTESAEPKKWKWNAFEAVKIIAKTYIDDFGAEVTQRDDLLANNPDIRDVEDKYVTGLEAGDVNDTSQPVIFIHGSPANALRWKDYLLNTPKGYNYIAIDRMGFGMRGMASPDLELDYKILRRFIGQFKNPIVVAHSLGGAIALRLATQLDLKGLVLIASSLDPAQEKIMKAQEWGRNKFVSKLLSHSVRHSNEEMFQLQDFMTRTEPHLKMVKCPVEVIHAQDDTLVSTDQTTYLKSHVPHANITLPRRGGHAIPWARPEMIQGAVDNLTHE